MRTSLVGLLFTIMSAQVSYAQSAATEQEIVDLSRAKWQWMSEKNADTLATLFHDQARFVHMSGTWGKDEEVDIIRSGRIHYKQADVHEVVVEVFEDTAILWNRITLLAVVRGDEVSNPFTVTEVYKRQENGWKLCVLIAPVADGGVGTPALFDVDGDGVAPQRLAFESADRRAGDVLWLRYRVEKNTGS